MEWWGILLAIFFIPIVFALLLILFDKGYNRMAERVVKKIM